MPFNFVIATSMHISFLVIYSEVSDEDNDETVMENACSSLFMCIITTLNFGLRSGGGIGDVLRAPSVKVSHHLPTDKVVHGAFHDQCTTKQLLFL